ncbi:hypothetical protein FACS1894208_12980 [Clostridia bacterium]|nr:hypothetical protein FACS1894208_12980 [Clostridia bacterium]
MANPLSIFRIVAAEFAAVDDATVETWIELTRPLVSRKRFGKVYEQALALLTAHRMKVAAVGSDESASGEFDGVGGVGVGFKIGNYSSGGESIGFNNSVLTSKLNPDAEFTQTVYGVQYLTLRNLHTVAIINAGEVRC